MISIIAWIFWVAMSAIGRACNSKALKTTKIQPELFKLLCYFVNTPVVIFLLYLQWGLDPVFLSNSSYLYIIIWGTLFAIASTLLWYSAIRQTKVSHLLPYENLDKLFIVIIGFILYYGTDQESSWVTFCIAIATIFVTIVFTIDFKNISFPKSIQTFFAAQFCKAIYVSSIWYVLLYINMITFAIVLIISEIILYIALARVKKNSLKNMFEQSKIFYQQRFTGTAFSFTAWLIGIYIIKDAGIIIATLLWFFAIAFQILSNKFILKDSPNIKQMICAGVVIVLIGIGYYFK